MKTAVSKTILVVACLAGLLAAAAPTASTTLNVRDFGAKGDGVADDTTAIQAAIDAALKDPSHSSAMFSIVYYGVSPEILFPSGTYRVTR